MIWVNHVTFQLYVATTAQGPSSSGVRLQQAKTMLEKAAEVLNHLEEAANSAEATSDSSSAQVNYNSLCYILN